MRRRVRGGGAPRLRRRVRGGGAPQGWRRVGDACAARARRGVGKRGAARLRRAVGCRERREVGLRRWHGARRRPFGFRLRRLAPQRERNFFVLVFAARTRQVRLRRFTDAVVRANRGANVVGRRDHRANVQVRTLRDLFERLLVRRIVHRDVERVAEPANAAHVDGNEAVPLDDVDGHEGEELPRKVDVMQGHPGHAQLLAEDLGYLRLGNETAFDEQAAETLAVSRLFIEGFLELYRGNQARSHEQLAQFHPGSVHSTRQGTRFCRVSRNRSIRPAGRPWTPG